MAGLIISFKVYTKVVRVWDQSISGWLRLQPCGVYKGKKNQPIIFFLFCIAHQDYSVLQKKQMDTKTILYICLALGVGLIATTSAGIANLYKLTSSSSSGSPADKATIPSWGTAEASKWIDGFALAGSVVLTGLVVYAIFYKS